MAWANESERLEYEHAVESNPITEREQWNGQSGALCYIRRIAEIVAKRALPLRRKCSAFSWVLGPLGHG